MTVSTRLMTTGNRRSSATVWLCVLVFCAAAAWPAAVAAGKAPSLRLFCEHDWGLVSGGRATTVYVRLFDWEPTKRPLVLEHKVTDWWGRTSGRGTHEVKLAGQWVRQVKLDLDRYGPYTFEAELREADDGGKAGKSLATARLRVVRAVQVERLTPEQRARSSFGVNTHYEAKWPALQAMGIHWARDYCWGWLTDGRAAPRASNGVDFAPIDRAATAAGVTVLPCMMACFRTPDKKRYVADAAGIREAYERLGRAFPNVAFWELDNESDLQFHGSTVGYEAYMDSYVAYIRHAAEGLQAAGGKAKVVLNGDAGIYYDRTVRLLNSAAKDDFAVVNCHYYTGTVAPELSRKDYNTGAENPEGAATFLDRLRAISQLAHSRRRECWLTEIGWDATYGPAVGERLQAIYLARMYLLARFCGVDKTFWFFDRDTKGAGKFASCGLIDVDDNVRPAGAAMAAVSKFTALAEYAGSVEIGPDRWCLLFKRPGGGWLAAAWSVASEHPLPGPLAKAKGVDLFGNPLAGGKLTPEPAYFQLDSLPAEWEAQRTAEWLSPSILTASPGGSVSVSAKLPAGAAGGWQGLPAGVTGGKWSAGGSAKAELVCSPAARIGEHRLTAVAEGKSWRRTWPLVLRVVAPLTASSEPYWPDVPAELSLQPGGRRAVDVELSVSPKLGKLAPAMFTVPPTGARAAFVAAKTAAGPIAVTAKLAGGAKMTHYLRPGRIDVVEVGEIKLDGDLADWPKAAALDGRAFESSAGLDPAVRVGWSNRGLWLAARLPAKDLAAGDPKQFWDWTCAELFVDTSGESSRGWGAKAHQFWLTPVREGGTWRLYVGEWKRGPSIDATLYDDRRVKTGVRVEAEAVVLEALIPAEAIGAKPQAGLVWRAAVTAQVTRPLEATIAAAWPRSKRSGLLEGAAFLGQFRLVRADGSVPGGVTATATPPKPKRTFPGPERWEKNISAFEARDKESPPPAGEILFVGSSSIVGWNTKKWFPDLKTINRGFGGSDVSDSLHFADRIVLPYRPRVIVLYAGDNDISRGKSPQRVLADYKAFVAKVHAALPKARIVFVPIKPSIARWKLVGKMRQANAMVRAVTEADERLGYVDIDTPMIGPDGRPRGELFKKDGLHLNDEGYKLWSSLLRPHLVVKPGGK
jgi:lysophospholipase L1-like esterase